MRGSKRGEGTGVRTTPENHKNIGFLSNTGLDRLKDHKAAKPAFNGGPSSARQRNAVLMAFRWRAVDGPLIVVLDPFPLKQQRNIFFKKILCHS